jgi:hypothetical protein
LWQGGGIVSNTQARTNKTSMAQALKLVNDNYVNKYTTSIVRGLIASSLILGHQLDNVH